MFTIACGIILAWLFLGGIEILLKNPEILGEIGLIVSQCIICASVIIIIYCLPWLIIPMVVSVFYYYPFKKTN